jgi:hypothetical protein
LASRREWRRHGCIRRTLVSPNVVGERGSVAGFGKEGVKRSYHLRAFSNRRGNSFDRSRAHVADREYAWQAGFEWPVDVGARAREALISPVRG